MPNNAVSVAALPGSKLDSHGTWYSGPAYMGVGLTPVSIDFSLGEGGFPTPYYVDVVYWKNGTWYAQEYVITTGSDTITFDVGSATENVMTQPHFRVRSGSLPVEVIADPGENDPFVPAPAPPVLPPVYGPMESPIGTPDQGLDPDSCPIQGLPLLLPPWMSPIANTATPLVIDLDDDGIELTNLDNDSVYWDVNNDGFKEATAWLQADDAFLVMDWNNNGLIDNHSELFGTRTIDGFTKLTELDSNTDNLINSSDTLFGDLQIWQDLNQDGISQSNELQSLTAAGIASISLADTANYSIVEGNDITNQSIVTMTDTTTREIHDVWFRYDIQNTHYVGDYDLDIRTLFLPTLRGYGDLKDLSIQMSLDEELLNRTIDLVSMTLENVIDPTLFFDAKFKEMLYQWSGDPSYDWLNSYSTYADARKVGFVQDVAGEQMNAVNNLAVNQATVFWEEGLWEKIVTYYMANFLTQTVFSDLFTGTVEYNPSMGVVSGATGLSSTVLDDIKTLIDGTGDPAYGWSLVVRTVEEVIGVDNLSGGDFTLLDDAIQDSVPSLDLETVRDIILGDPNLVTGTSGNETITGSLGDDRLDGGQGNDTLEGGQGDDYMWGAEGNDIYIGGSGDDVYFEWNTVNSNDTYYFDSGNDRIEDYYGTDKIVLPTGITLSDIQIERFLAANPSNNYIWQDANLTIHVDGLGSISIMGQYGYSGNAQYIETLEFADTSTLNLSTLDNFQMGTSGDDNIVGLDRAYYLNDRLDGGYGNDTLNGGLGRNLLKDDYGDDTYVYGGGLDTIMDTNGSSDEIVFDNSYDPNLFTVTFDALQSPADSIENSMNIYYDGELKVIVHGALLIGYNFIESLVIDGVQTIDLTQLDNTQHGTSGNDEINGFDSYVWDDNTIYGYDGDDYLYGRGGDDTIDGGDGADTILGGDDNDTLFGGAGADSLDAGYGNDILHGDAGNDTLYAYYGNDTLYGGDGLDTLNGGQGADTFVFEADTAFNNVDVVQDFNYWQSDKLDISDLLIGYTPGTSDLNDFMSLTTAGSHSTVYIDRDGTGSTYSSEDIATLQYFSGFTVDDLMNHGNIIV